MDSPDASQTVLQRARRYFPPGFVLAQKLAGRNAWETGATGAWVYLSDGRSALDFGSYGVTLLGHRHPAVMDAVRSQLDVMTTSTRVLANPWTVDLSEWLVDALDPDRLRSVWFGLNGCDVVEAALKLARAATGRPRILAAVGGFHGKSLGALAATWNTRYRGPAAGTLAPATHVELDEESVAREVARGDVAALIVEPIQGEAGVVPLPPGLLRRWAEDARQAGAFVVFDEIQVGLGRCGPLSLSLEYQVQPDAVLLGKHLGGGVLPLSALIGTERLFAPLRTEPFLHTLTFSGHPLSCAAGLAACQAIKRLGPRIGDLGVALVTELDRLVRAYPDVFTSFRGRGLLWGLTCASPAVAGNVITEMTAENLLVSPCLSRPDVVRLLPPAILTDQELATASVSLHRAAAATRAWLGTG